MKDLDYDRNWSQGDDDDYFPLDRWGRLDDDYAYGAEVSRS